MDWLPAEYLGLASWWGNGLAALLAVHSWPHYMAVSGRAASKRPGQGRATQATVPLLSEYG